MKNFSKRELIISLEKRVKEPKFLLVLFFYILLFGVILKEIIEIITLNNQMSIWLGFWGSVMGGIIGGTVTLLGLQLTFKESHIRETKKLKRYYEPFDNEMNWFAEILDQAAARARNYKTDEEVIEKLLLYKAEAIGEKKLEKALEYCKEELPMMHYHVNWYISNISEIIDNIIKHINTRSSNDQMELCKYILDEKKAVENTRDIFLKKLEEFI